MTAATGSMVEQYKAMVRAEWTDDQTVRAWRRWKQQFVIQTAEATQLIVEAADLRPGLEVLDVASGTGEPSLNMAAIVGPTGHVTATDLGMGMLSMAEDEAKARGLSQMSFRQADVHGLPFADGSFDRVTCRFGVMYFADAQAALSEIRRVLRPGGRAAFVAWGLFENNPFMSSLAGPFLRRAGGAPPPPDAPTPFRFGPAGTLSAALNAAGFGTVNEETRDVLLPWPGSPEELWQHFRDVAAPFRDAIEGLSEAERNVAVGEVLAALRPYYDGTRVATPGSLILATAVR